MMFLKIFWITSALIGWVNGTFTYIDNLKAEELDMKKQMEIYEERVRNIRKEISSCAQRNRVLHMLFEELGGSEGLSDEHDVDEDVADSCLGYMLGLQRSSDRISDRELMLKTKEAFAEQLNSASSAELNATFADMMAAESESKAALLKQLHRSRRESSRLSALIEETRNKVKSIMANEINSIQLSLSNIASRLNEGVDLDSFEIEMLLTEQDRIKLVIEQLSTYDNTYIS